MVGVSVRDGMWALVAAALTAAPVLAADPSMPTPTPAAASASAATPATAAGSTTARDPDDQHWANDKSMRGAISTPLRDVNLIRAKIPDVLLDAMDAPYARPEAMSCDWIAGQVAALDAVLGPDLDQLYSPAHPGLVQRSQSMGAMAVKGASEYFIPGIGFIKYLSGAERHETVVRAAIEAGAMRRAYLKGMGLSIACDPPAAPLPAATTAIPGASRALAHKVKAPKTPKTR